MNRISICVVAACALIVGGCGGDTKNSASGGSDQQTPGQVNSVCGNGAIESGEACDDSNTLTETLCDYGDATCTLCSADCQRVLNLEGPYCGDGVTNSDYESCDDSNALDETQCEYGTPTCTACSADCQTDLNLTGAYCGDGVKDSEHESCDDSNLDTGDGCDVTCSQEPGWNCESGDCLPICGDGVIVGQELCDDGNTFSLDGCNSLCEVELGFECSGELLSICSEVCGDGLRVGEEECDDGNDDPLDGCDLDCGVEWNWQCSAASPSVCTNNCGNGIIDEGEWCDLGAVNNTGEPWTCSSECTAPPSCGNGRIESGEECDDGNMRFGDGCGGDCYVELGFECRYEEETILVSDARTEQILLSGIWLYRSTGDKFIERTDLLGNSKRRINLMPGSFDLRIRSLVNLEGGILALTERAEGENQQIVELVFIGHDSFDDMSFTTIYSAALSGAKWSAMTIVDGNLFVVEEVLGDERDRVLHLPIAEVVDAKRNEIVPSWQEVANARKLRAVIVGDEFGKLYLEALVLRNDALVWGLVQLGAEATGQSVDCDFEEKCPLIANLNHLRQWSPTPTGVVLSNLSALESFSSDSHEGEVFASYSSESPLPAKALQIGGVYLVDSPLGWQWVNPGERLFDEAMTGSSEDLEPAVAVSRDGDFIATLRKGTSGNRVVTLRPVADTSCRRSVVGIQSPEGNSFGRVSAGNGAGHLSIAGYTEASFDSVPVFSRDGFLGYWDHQGKAKQALQLSSAGEIPELNTEEDIHVFHRDSISGDTFVGATVCKPQENTALAFCIPQLFVHHYDRVEFGELPAYEQVNSAIGVLMRVDSRGQVGWVSSLRGDDIVIADDHFDSLSGAWTVVIRHTSEVGLPADVFPPEVVLPGSGEVTTSVLKFDSTGALLWHWSGGATEGLVGGSLAVDKSNPQEPIYWVGGHFNGTLESSLGGDVSQNEDGIILGLRDLGGDVETLAPYLIAGTNYERVLDIDVGSNNDLWVSGRFYGSLFFKRSGVVNLDIGFASQDGVTTNAFVMKISSDSQPQWAKELPLELGSSQAWEEQYIEDPMNFGSEVLDSHGYSIVADRSGGAVVGSHSSYWEPDALAWLRLSHLDSDGMLLWQRDIATYEPETTFRPTPLERDSTRSVVLGVTSDVMMPVLLPEKIVYPAVGSNAPTTEFDHWRFYEPTYMSSPFQGLMAHRISWDAAGLSCSQEEGCVSSCGDSVVAVLGETCDDGNNVSGDGCDATCQLEPGWECTIPGVFCESRCGDGIAVGREQCDDGNLISLDGCSQFCSLESVTLCSEEEGCVDINTPDFTECESDPSACDATGGGSTDLSLDTPQSLLYCSSYEVGERRDCGNGAGACSFGVQLCNSDRTWSECEGEVGPSEEVCDGVDNDCDGSVDEGFLPISCGSGACAQEVLGCVNGVLGECTAGSPSDEVCNGEDDDCDGYVDEELSIGIPCGVGACARTISGCENGVAQSCIPGAPSAEVCNGIDDDCDGEVDNMGTVSCGHGECAVTVETCVGGVLSVCEAAVQNTTDETCNGRDDDCDGGVDEGVSPEEINPESGVPASCGVGECFRDSICAGGVWQCEEGEPSAEVCNGKDDDCDGEIDNGVDCFDYSCDSDSGNDPNCDSLTDDGNRPPFIDPRTRISTNSDPLVCLNNFTLPGMGSGGSLWGGGVTTDPGGGGSGFVIFQTCNLEVIYGDPDGLMPTLSIDWGDDSGDSITATGNCIIGTSPTTYAHSNNYTAAGDYEIVISVTDNDGATASMVLPVEVTLPTAVTTNGMFGPVTTYQGGGCSFTSPLFYVDDSNECKPLNGAVLCGGEDSVTDCPGLEDETIALDVVTWTNGNNGMMFDGSLSSQFGPDYGGVAVECEAGSDRMYYGRTFYYTQNSGEQWLWADGYGDAVTAQFKVGNERPTLTIEDSDNNEVDYTLYVKAGEVFKLSALGEDSDGHIVGYRWEEGLAQADRVFVAEGSVLEHYFASAGDYHLTATVWDDAGGRRFKTVRVIASNEFNEVAIASQDFLLAQPDNEANAQVFEISINTSTVTALEEVDVALNFRTHESLSDRRGLIRWTAGNEGPGEFSLVAEDNGESTGSEHISLDGQSSEVWNQNGELTLRFSWLAKAEPVTEDYSRQMTRKKVLPSYRLKTASGYYDEGPDDSGGWENIDTPYWIVRTVPEISLENSGAAELEDYVYFDADWFSSLVWFSFEEPPNRVLFVKDYVELRWIYGDGESGQWPWHRYNAPGSYEVELEITYDGGWVTRSPVLQVRINGDTDLDGVPDYDDVDRDGDGICDLAGVTDEGGCSGGPDLFLWDKGQWEDSDGDGYGDNLEGCAVYLDSEETPPTCWPDLFPNDSTEWWDSDRDGIGDNADTDDDNDGLSDADEDIYGTNSLVFDSDGDGLGDGDEKLLWGSSWDADSDNDGDINLLDPDSDDDGLLDGDEWEPTVDHDSDGTMSILDADSDNDGVSDGVDLWPYSEALVIPSALGDVGEETSFWKTQHPAGFIRYTEEFVFATTTGTSSIKDWEEEGWDINFFGIGCGDLIDYDWVRQRDPDLDVSNSDLSLAAKYDAVDAMLSDGGYEALSVSGQSYSRGPFPAYDAEDWYTTADCSHQRQYILEYDLVWESRDVELTNNEPKEVQYNSVLNYSFHMDELVLAKEVDNTLTIQFMLDKSSDLSADNGDNRWVKPGFNYRVYYLPDQSDAEELNLIGHEPFMEGVVEGVSYSASDSASDKTLYRTFLRIPREALEDFEENTTDDEPLRVWVYLSPIWSSLWDGEKSQLPLVPDEFDLSITGMLQDVSGLSAQLVTRIPDEDTPDLFSDIREELMGYTENSAWKDDTSEQWAERVVQWSGVIQAGDYRVYVVNRISDWDAGISSSGQVGMSLSRTETQAIDAVLILSRRPEELSSLVPELIDFGENISDWYLMASPEEQDDLLVEERFQLREYSQGSLIDTIHQFPANITMKDGWDGYRANLDLEKWNYFLDRGGYFASNSLAKLQIKNEASSLYLNKTKTTQIISDRHQQLHIYRQGTNVNNGKPMWAAAHKVFQNEVQADGTVKRVTILKERQTITTDWDTSGRSLAPTADDSDMIKRITQDHESRTRVRMTRIWDYVPNAAQRLSTAISYYQIAMAYKEGNTMTALALTGVELVDVGLELNYAIALSQRLKYMDAASNARLDRALKFQKGFSTAVGVIVVGVQLYAVLKAENELVRQAALRRFAITAIDTTIAIGAPMVLSGPAAGYVMAIEVSWAATAVLFGDLILGVDPVVHDLVGSPSAAASTVFTYFFTNAIPSPIVEGALNNAVNRLYEHSDYYAGQGYYVVVIPPEGCEGGCH